MPEVILPDDFYGGELEEFVFFKILRRLITNPKFKEVLNKSTCADCRQIFRLPRQKTVGVLADFKVF